MHKDLPQKSNRLINETSPYLLQHAYNPVDWYPWGEEALERAKAEDKPILVSIGYSACHWCHVMERESFENAETAAIMNQNFISIKIDREERPDIDQIYMDAVTAINGSGGWPLNVFLTPELKPFFGGTYFPPVRAHGLNSWREVLHGIAQSWQSKRDMVHQQAETLTDHLQKSFTMAGLAAKANGADGEWVVTTMQALLKSADKEWGGFSAAPKFPQTMSIRLLLWQYEYYGLYHMPSDLPFSREELLQTAVLALDKMMYGGIYDQLQGGFARYSTDRYWLAPHFEKMLYDNALLIGAYCHAYAITGNAEYKRIVEQTMDFVASEWQDEDGGFFSAYDADSEGEEGKYYVWDKKEIYSVTGDETLTEMFCEAYGVKEAGNWEHTNILWRNSDWEALARLRNMTPEAFAQQIESVEAKLLAVRQSRPKPLLDDKKLMGWNSLMVKACYEAAATFAKPEFAAMGERGLAFIDNCLKTETAGYHHNYKGGKAANPAFLDDLAYYADALITAVAYTGKNDWLRTAESVMDYINDNFSDEENLLYWYTPAVQQDIPLRKKEVYDGAIPSGNSIMCRNLLVLGVLLDRSEWKQRAQGMAAAFAQTAGKYPNSFATWAQVVLLGYYGTREVAVIGPKAGEFAAVLLQKRLPNAIYQWATHPVEAYPFLAGKPLLSEDTAIFLCENYTCQQPVYSTEAFFRLSETNLK